jgi:hypothetical protein
VNALSPVTECGRYKRDICDMTLITFFVIEVINTLVNGWKNGKSPLTEKELKQINR